MEKLPPAVPAKLCYERRPKPSSREILAAIYSTQPLKSRAPRGRQERKIHVKNILIVSLGLAATLLFSPAPARAQAQSAPVSAKQATKEIKIISSAGARALADACSAWAEQNKQVLAMAILDWGGNLIEAHAMEGASMNAIDTALLKAKSALRWRRPTSETNKMVRSG